MRSAVRSHQTIDAEVAVVGLVSEATAIRPVSVFGYSLVHKVPYRRATTLVIGYVYQRTHPQLHRAEDAAKPPHILILKVTAV